MSKKESPTDEANPLLSLSLGEDAFDDLVNKPLRETVFQTLRRAIIDGTLKPGEHLMEVQLADQLGVSRTPVRESLRKLELEGLVSMVPRKGAYVSAVSIADLQEMMEIRCALEGLVAKLVAVRGSESQIEKLKDINQNFEKSLKENDVPEMIKCDVEFHETLYNACGNDRLRGIVSSLREQMLRMRQMYVHCIDDKIPLVGQHDSIIKAIEKREGDEASIEARKHISMTHKDMIRVLSEELEET